MSPAKNLLVMQSGGPTPVINRSLFGICDEAATLGAFTGVFGAQGGVEGVLSDRVFDLASISTAAWPAIAVAPGAALGTTRKKFSDSELPRVIEFIERREITHWLIIGGNDSASTALTVSTAAKDAGHDLKVLLVPKTVDKRSRWHGPLARLRQRGSLRSRGDTRGRTGCRGDGPRRADNRDRGRRSRLRLAGCGVRTRQAGATRRAAYSRHAGNAVRPVASSVGNRKRLLPVRVRRCGHPRECTRPTWTATCRGTAHLFTSMISATSTMRAQADT